MSSLSTPRTAKNPHFCFDHAQKEARARAAQSLGKDLAYFFSGDYLSACDLSSALGRLIPAVLRGDVKPRTARTVAYPAQTLLQSIHLSEQEYSNGWSGPTISPRPSARLTARPNARELSFRAQRGTCFFFPSIHSAQGHALLAFRPANSDGRDFTCPAAAPSPTTCLIVRLP